MPVPVLALDEALLLVLAALLLVVVLLVVVELVVVALEEPPALLVDASPPVPLVEGPGPSATLPLVPPKPPSPSLLPPVSAALAQPCAALPIASAPSTKLTPIVFTHASDAG
jgi:hypothetical protein